MCIEEAEDYSNDLLAVLCDLKSFRALSREEQEACIGQLDSVLARIDALCDLIDRRE